MSTLTTAEQTAGISRKALATLARNLVTGTIMYLTSLEAENGRRIGTGN